MGIFRDLLKQKAQCRQAEILDYADFLAYHLEAGGQITETYSSLHFPYFDSFQFVYGGGLVPAAMNIIVNTGVEFERATSLRKLNGEEGRTFVVSPDRDPRTSAQVPIYGEVAGVMKARGFEFKAEHFSPDIRFIPEIRALYEAQPAPAAVSSTVAGNRKTDSSDDGGGLLDLSIMDLMNTKSSERHNDDCKPAPHADGKPDNSRESGQCHDDTPQGKGGDFGGGGATGGWTAPEPAPSFGGDGGGGGDSGGGGD